MEYTLFSHQTNIIIHVIAGVLALLSGMLAILTTTRVKLHRLSGRWFLRLMALVVLTGLLGVILFSRNTFLLIITLLSGYMAFSGYRAIRHRSNQFYPTDGVVIIVTLTTALYFLYRFTSSAMIWSPVIIYGTIGYLLMALIYDSARYLIPVAKYGNLWLYEHILKMISAFSGLLSAFTGTVLPQYQPYSQFLPSVAGTLLAVGFMISVYQKHRYNTSKNIIIR